MADKMRLELEPIDSSSVEALSKRMDALKQRGVEAAEALSRDEISAKDYQAVVKEINPQLRALEGAYRALTASQREAAEAAKAIEAELREATETTARLEAQLRSETTATTDATTAKRSAAVAIDKVGRAAGDAKAKTAGMGQSMLELGRIVQDFQAAGLRGILNNLEGITLALGRTKQEFSGAGWSGVLSALKGPAGLAGAVTIAAVAFETFKPQIKAAWDALNPDRPREAANQIERLGKRIEELKDTQVKLAVDRHELDQAEAQIKRLRAAQDEFRRAQGQQTAAEAEAGKTAAQAIVEQGEPEISTAIKQRYIREQTALSERTGAIKQARDARAKAEEDLKQAEQDVKSLDPVKHIRAVWTLANAPAAIEAAKEQALAARDAIKVNAETFYGDLAKSLREGAGDVQRLAREQFARQLEGIGRARLAAQIRATTPESVNQAKAQKEQENEARKQEEAQKEIDRAKTQQAKKQLEEHLKAMKDLGGVAQIANDVVAESETRGLEGPEQLEFVRNQIAETIKGGLEHRGFTAPGEIGMQETINKAASAYTKDALGEQKKEVAGRIKAAETAAKKTEESETKEKQKSIITQRAQQVQEQSEFFTGMQFNKGESTEIAKHSVELQAKGLSANQATLQAMNEALIAMAKLGNQEAQQALWARQMGNQFGQIARRADQGQPSALSQVYGPY